MMPTEHNEHSGRDATEPHSGTIWIYTVITLLFLGVVQIVGHYAFLSAKDSEHARKQAYVVPSRDLQLINLQGAEQMQQYKWLDKEKGIVQIPVSRAMELLIQPSGGDSPASSETSPESGNR